MRDEKLGTLGQEKQLINCRLSFVCHLRAGEGGERGQIRRHRANKNG